MPFFLSFLILRRMRKIRLKPLCPRSPTILARFNEALEADMVLNSIHDTYPGLVRSGQKICHTFFNTGSQKWKLDIRKCNTKDEKMANLNLSKIQLTATIEATLHTRKEIK